MSSQTLSFRVVALFRLYYSSPTVNPSGVVIRFPPRMSLLQQAACCTLHKKRAA